MYATGFVYDILSGATIASKAPGFLRVCLSRATTLRTGTYCFGARIASTAPSFLYVCLCSTRLCMISGAAVASSTPSTSARDVNHDVRQVSGSTAHNTFQGERQFSGTTLRQVSGSTARNALCTTRAPSFRHDSS
jgi:hypothetical protein